MRVEGLLRRFITLANQFQGIVDLTKENLKTAKGLGSWTGRGGKIEYLRSLRDFSNLNQFKYHTKQLEVKVHGKAHVDQVTGLRGLVADDDMVVGDPVVVLPAENLICVSKVSTECIQSVIAGVCSADSTACSRASSAVLPALFTVYIESQRRKNDRQGTALFGYFNSLPASYDGFDMLSAGQDLQFLRPSLFQCAVEDWQAEYQRVMAVVISTLGSGVVQGACSGQIGLHANANVDDFHWADAVRRSRAFNRNIMAFTAGPLDTDKILSEGQAFRPLPKQDSHHQALKTDITVQLGTDKLVLADAGCLVPHLGMINHYGLNMNIVMPPPTPPCLP